MSELTTLTPATETSAVPPEDDFSSRFAELTKRDKVLREKQKALKEQQSEYERFRGLKETAKTNPKVLLQEYGLTMDDLLASVVGDSDGYPDDSVEGKLERLERQIKEEREERQREIEERKNSEKERQRETYDKAIEDHKKQISSVISSDPERFELIAFHEAEDLVWAVTEEHFAQHNEVLEPAKAAEKVEEFLLERTKKATSLKKIAGQQPKATENLEPTIADALSIHRRKSVGVTTRDVTAPVEPPALSRKEAERRAIAMLQSRHK